MVSDFSLRDVLEADLPIFFAYQLDPDARAMAAFTAKDPTDRQAFLMNWHRILADPSTINRTMPRRLRSVWLLSMDRSPVVSAAIKTLAILKLPIGLARTIGAKVWPPARSPSSWHTSIRLARSLHVLPKTIVVRYGS